MIAKLTDRFLQTNRPKRNVEIFDEGGRGFGARIGPRGVSFFVVYRRRGRKERATIGRYDPKGARGLRLADARREADRIRGGKLDPAGERRRAREAGTFAEVCRRFLTVMPRARRRADEPRLRPLTAITYRRQIENLLIPRLGDLPIAEITKRDLQELFSEIAETRPIHANRVYALTRRLFSWAKSEGLIAENPAAELERPGGAEQARGREWTAAELRAVLEGADDEEPIPRALVRLAFLTACRGGELRRAEWSWVDREKRLLRLPAEATKSARARKVPLTRQALEALEELRAVTGASRYLFPGGREGSYLATVAKPIARIRKRSGVSFSLHDARDAVGDFVAERYGVEISKRVLGHAVVTGATKAYLSTERLDEQRRALQAWADYLDALRSGESARVLEFSK